MYSYNQVEAIKTNLEWIVNQATLNHASPSRTDQKALFDLLELIQSYEILLDLIREFGTDVIDMHIAEGLAVTEKLIAKVKKPRESHLTRSTDMKNLKGFHVYSAHSVFAVRSNEKAVCAVLSFTVCLLPRDDHAGRTGL
ncbi:hypothetical protein [Enterobacter sichuanensis]|uniref:hypothetical protein n=1 Tax=Enterobacter sichuanensis TaxID=2071710 RepID=UPI003593EF60